MRKTFTIIGYIAAGFALILAVVAIIFIPRAIRLQKEGVAYVDANIRAIVENWDEKALMARATPELLKSAKSPDEFARLFRYFKALESLKSFKEPTPGNVYSGSKLGIGAFTVANYTVEAEFEKGPATVTLQLYRSNDSWKINGFRVNSDVFLPK